MTKALDPYVQLLKTNEKKVRNPLEKGAMSMNTRWAEEEQMAFKFREIRTFKVAERADLKNSSHEEAMTVTMWGDEC